MINSVIVLGQFPGHVVSYFHLDFNEKSRQRKRGGGLRFLTVCTQRGGGSFRCVLCATGGVGVSKTWEKMRM